MKREFVDSRGSRIKIEKSRIPGSDTMAFRLTVAVRGDDSKTIGNVEVYAYLDEPILYQMAGTLDEMAKWLTHSRVAGLVKGAKAEPVPEPDFSKIPSTPPKAPATEEPVELPIPEDDILAAVNSGVYDPKPLKPDPEKWVAERHRNSDIRKHVLRLLRMNVEWSIQNMQDRIARDGVKVSTEGVRYVLKSLQTKERGCMTMRGRKPVLYRGVPEKLPSE